MLARNPDLPRVRLDLALAYFQAGEDGNAAYHFRLALGAKDLPAIVRARALFFLDQIRRRKAWSVTGSVAILPDNNINAATSAKLVNLFGLPSAPFRGCASDRPGGACEGRGWTICRVPAEGRQAGRREHRRS